MKFIFSILLASMLMIPVKGQDVVFNSRLDSVSYGLGILLGNSISQAGITEFNKELFLQGVKDITEKEETLFSMDEANNLLDLYMTDLEIQKAADNLAAAKKFLEENGKNEGVVTLPSGLQYMILEEGTGESPTDSSTVTVHYTGTFMNGDIFDSSVERGEPATFGVYQVIPGWTEALQLMKPGSKWMLYLPPDLAYGENSPQGIPANSLLIFEVELISFE